jgi:hypothetical protein
MQDVVVAKLNNNGALQWHTFLGSSNSDYSLGISLDSGGNIFIAGFSNANWGHHLMHITVLMIFLLQKFMVLQWLAEQ